MPPALRGAGKNPMQKVIEMLKAYLDERTAKPGEYSFAIGYGYDYEEACHFREMLKDLVMGTPGDR